MWVTLLVSLLQATTAPARQTGLTGSCQHHPHAPLAILHALPCRPDIRDRLVGDQVPLKVAPMYDIVLYFCPSLFLHCTKREGA